MAARHVKTIQPIMALSVPMPVCLMDTPIRLPQNYVAPDWCAEILEEWRMEKQLLAAGTFPTQSVLLQGPSGVGKSTAAMWVAQQLNKPLVTMRLSETIDSYMGSTGSNIAAALKYTITTGAILLIDEIDCISADRSAKDKDVGEIWRITNTFIQGLDDWHSQARRSLIIATTNMAECIDGAIRRRFELEAEMGFPQHVEICKIAGVALPEGLQISHANLRKLIVRAKRQSVLKGVDYALTLLGLTEEFRNNS
ncbi:unnamed protein product [Sphagnum balticum]